MRILLFLTFVFSASICRAGESQYFVIIGSYKVQNVAVKMLDDAKKSYESKKVRIIESTDDPTRYRLAIGPFDSFSSASSSRQTLIDGGKPNAWILPLNQTEEALPTDGKDPEPNFSPSALADLVTPSEHANISQLHEVRISKIEMPVTVLESEIATLTEAYMDRTVSVEQLISLKNKVNQLFVLNGYINSGVLIPDQRIDDGVLVFEVIEGSIADLNISSQLNSDFIRKRLNITEPFNLAELQTSLKLLEKNPLVRKIDANVSPGAKPGMADLTLTVDTAARFGLGLRLANDRSPSIGSENGEFIFTSRNLTGWGDFLEISTSFTEGLNSQDVLFNIPFNARDHSVSFYYSRSDSSVIEEPFDAVDVESKTESFGISFDLPLIRDLQSTWTLHLMFESRKNETSLLGQPFSFSEGAVNGESRVAPVRMAVSYISQGAEQSFAGRLAISKGTGLFEANRNADQADGDFVSYLAQFQYSRQVWDRLQVTTKLLAQISSDPLLSVERYSIGGMNSVRGYRQNQIVRDNAYLASIEARYRIDSVHFIELVGFFDWGSGENHDDAIAAGKDNIYSIGAGVSYRSLMGFGADLYIAHGLVDVAVLNRDLQDDGIHFRLVYDFTF